MSSPFKLSLRPSFKDKLNEFTVQTSLRPSLEDKLDEFTVQSVSETFSPTRKQKLILPIHLLKHNSPTFFCNLNQKSFGLTQKNAKIGE